MSTNACPSLALAAEVVSKCRMLAGPVAQFMTSVNMGLGNTGKVVQLISWII